jgi:predicted nucleic acid-binding protein
MDALELEVVPYPPLEQVRRCEEIIHRKDAHILAAAIEAAPDYLVTLDATHFLKDPSVSQKSGLRIASPRDFLEEVIRTGSTG